MTKREAEVLKKEKEKTSLFKLIMNMVPGIS